MSDEEIEKGMGLAERALFFCIFENGTVSVEDARAAIVTLFGSEIDAALVAKFGNRQ